jgi:hypothetical protein
MYLYKTNTVAEQFQKTSAFKVGDLKTAASNVCVPETKLVGLAEKENTENDAWCMDLGI